MNFTEYKKALDDKPGGTLTVINGVIYSWLNEDGRDYVWELVPTNFYSGFAWVPDFRKEKDDAFLDALRITAAMPSAVIREESPLGYNVKMKGDDGIVVTAWYQNIHDALIFAAGRGATQGHPTILGVFAAKQNEAQD